MSGLSTQGRIAFDHFIHQQAKLHNISEDAINKGATFSIDPSIEQKIEDKIQESDAFLSKINVIHVDEKTGQKLGLGIGSTLASTTDTDQNDRKTQDPSSVEKLDEYNCQKTDFDSHINFNKLDVWARYPDFQSRITSQVLKQIALDRIMIGFNGTSRSATSNRTTNPLLQDVNVGWLQKMREKAPQRVMGDATTSVEIGDNKDYKRIDALVADMRNNLLAPYHQDHPDLVVIMGRDLFADAFFKKFNKPFNPTDEISAQTLMQKGLTAGLPVIKAPFFIPDGLMVTTLDNLSLYVQRGSRRRAIIENHKRDRIEMYESSNDAYVIEDYSLCAVAQNIVIE